ncbi:MAG: hypothetical protein CMH50_00375 [Myxococcales bacterium]|nr:hypothetical protein [Myxococcales bacterium]
MLTHKELGTVAIDLASSGAVWVVTLYGNAEKLSTALKGNVLNHSSFTDLRPHRFGDNARNFAAHLTDIVGGFTPDTKHQTEAKQQSHRPSLRWQYRHVMALDATKPSDFLRFDDGERKIKGEDRSMVFAETKEVRAVPTNVVLPVLDKEKLRFLSRRTRVSQAAFLREAVADLLCKYRDEFKGSEFESLIASLENRSNSLIEGLISKEDD